MGGRIVFLRVFLVIFCVCCLFITFISNWREYQFRKASVPARAGIFSVTVKPMSGKAVASIEYGIIYRRDGKQDTIHFSTAQAFSDSEPLPEIAQLKKNVFFIHYIPKGKKHKTPHSERIYIQNGDTLESNFTTGWLTAMFVVLLFGYLLNPRIYRF